MHQSTAQSGRQPEVIAWQQVWQRFRDIWGYDDFRSPQGEIVRCLLAGQDALVVMPTGGGKSICFQLPALMQSGLTLVVSPLVALMEDQVRELRQKRLPAALLHSQMTKGDRHRVMDQLRRQQLRLLYLSPETLLSSPLWSVLCAPELRLNGIILDEAHCLTQWGDTFRPAYRRLGAVRAALLAHKPAGTAIALAAFTATADPQAQDTLRTVLQLHNPQQFLLNPYRDNLALAVQRVWTPRGRRQRLWQWVEAHRGKTGLVYVRSRRGTEELAQWLTQQGLTALAYHAGLSAQRRRQVEAQWLSGEVPIVVCTSAFGMGINKPDCRWIAHFNPPALLSEYVQEVGRAGRDGKPAAAMMWVSEPTGWLDPTDQQLLQAFRQRGRSLQQSAHRLLRQLPEQGSIQAIAHSHKDGELALAWLHSQGAVEWVDPFHYARCRPSHAPTSHAHTAMDIEHYIAARGCRWQALLQAFGFAAEARQMQCGRCDRCQRLRT